MTRNNAKPGYHSAPTFVPFSEFKELSIYYRNLPHWRQRGATYFATIRLADSIPQSVILRWKDERRRFFLAHGIGLDLQFNDPAGFEIAYQQIRAEVRRAFEQQQARQLQFELRECHGSCVLRLPAIREMVADSLRHFDGQRYWLGDYVIMPNHVHCIVQPVEQWDLEFLLGSIKKWTARLMGIWAEEHEPELSSQLLSDSRAFEWQHESYDRIIRDHDELITFRNYIRTNPEKAKLPASDFTHHQATWF